MKLMVLDGNSIINRAFYGVKPLTTRDGLYTNAIFGFLNMLQRFVDEEQPEALCVAFDRKEPTFRHEADANYKATRKGMPEELAQQMPVMKQVLAAMSVPCYELAGYEADDLIGTISRKCQAAGWDCVIVTGDKDSLQLITDHTKVKLVSTRMGQTTTKDMTPETFREAYGFDPIHMIDLKGLMGDTSDNIPGVKGVGEKTAMGLVQKFGCIENLYANFDDPSIKGALRTKLDNGREEAKMSYDLATIHCDAPIGFKPEDALRRDVDRDALYQLFLKLEFTKLIERYGLSAPTVQTEEAPESNAEQIADSAAWQAAFDRLKAADIVAVLPLPDLSGVMVKGGGVFCAAAVVVVGVARNRKQPRPHILPAVKRFQAVQRPEKGLLRQLLGQRFAAGKPLQKQADIPEVEPVDGFNVHSQPFSNTPCSCVTTSSDS